MFSRLMEILATGIYSGKSPWAPGTMGTLVAVPFVILCARFFSPVTYMIFTLLFVLAAVFISEWYERQAGQHDSQEIVIDEVVGFFVAMTWLPMTWQAVIAGFVLFRLFDAVKPFPISVVDRRVQGGLGVVADDVVAGLVTNVILQVIFVKTEWLGVQWVAQ